MLRRVFIAGAATFALLARPLRAQQSATRRTRIGILIYSTPERDPNTQALLEGFRQLGYVDGQNVNIEYRYAQGQPERLPELATDLVQSKPDVIFALGGDVTPHAAKATQAIPIVYVMSADPVQLGVAKSLAKPGGNSTGVTLLSDQLAAKRLEIFKEAAPPHSTGCARSRSQPCRQRIADRRTRSQSLDARVAAGRNTRSC
jgi:putative ABC transport system substrate-binding protein